MSGEIFHAPLLAVNPGFDLTMVLQRNSDKAKQRYPHTKIARSVDEVINHNSVELVVINTPNDSHYHYATQALEAGKHIIVEKPFTVSTQEADNLILEIFFKWPNIPFSIMPQSFNVMASFGNRGAPNFIQSEPASNHLARTGGWRSIMPEGINSRSGYSRFTDCINSDPKILAGKIPITLAPNDFAQLISEVVVHPGIHKILRSRHTSPISGRKKGEAMNWAPTWMYRSVMTASRTVPTPNINPG